MADTSLIFKIIARDQTTAVMNRLKRTAESTGSFVAKALGGPALLPVLGAGVAGVAGLGAALGAAGAAGGVFGAVMASSMTEVKESATKVEDLRAKMQLYGKQAELAAAAGMDNEKYLKKQAEAALELKARLANLPPETRNATMAYLDMKSGWESFVESNKPATYGTLTSGYKLLGSVIERLQPLYDIGKRAVDRLIGSLQGAVDGGFIERMAARAGPAMDSLVSIVINMTRAVGGFMGKFNGQGQGILVWLEKVTAKWAAWANDSAADSGMSRFVAYVQQHGPTVVTMLTNLAQAAMNIAQAVTPLAPLSLAVASALAAVIAAVPPGVITAIVAGFIAFSAAMKIHQGVTAVMTALQWAQNAAFLGSPITWIVLAIVGLIAVIVLLATKTRFFQTVWDSVWKFMKGVGAWFAGPFAQFFVRLWQGMVAGVTNMKNGVVNRINAVKAIFTALYNHGKAQFLKVVSAAASLVSYFQKIPGRVGGALRNVFSGLWTGFKSVANRIIGGWNNLQFSIGGGSFAGISIPSVSFGTPNIPYLATGGDVRRTGLAVVHAGERITKAAQARRTGPGTGSRAGFGGTVIRIEGSNAKVVRLLIELLRDGIRDLGGDPVRVLTPR